MDNVFFGNFDKLSDIADYFDEPADLLDGCTVLYANYCQEGYEAWAQVIYRGPDLKLYEVVSRHNSTCGLENSWQPGEVTVASLKMRPNPRHEFNYSGLSRAEMDALCRVYAGDF